MKHSQKIVAVVMSTLITGVGITYGVKNEVNKEIEPVNVYYAESDLKGGTRIEKEMVYVESFPRKNLPKNAITDEEQVIGKYVKEGHTIPKTAMLFTDFLTTDNEPVSAIALDLKEGEYSFLLTVNTKEIIGDVFKENMMIDISFKALAKDLNGNTNSLYGTLYENIRIAAVQKDDEKKTSTIVLAVSKEQEQVLNKASNLGELAPLIKNGEVMTDSVNIVQSDELISFINKHSVSSLNINEMTLPTNKTDKEIIEEQEQKEIIKNADNPNWVNPYQETGK